MIEFITTYWLEVLFSLVLGGFGIFFRKFWKMLKQENEKNKEALMETVKSGTLATLRESEARLQAQIDVLAKDNANVIAGLLSIQGNQFKDRCRMLLRQEHEVTVDEFEDLSKDHCAYNALGGNHSGDELFEMVKTKFQSEITHHE